MSRVRNCFAAPPGWTFWARDYAGIEALLVGEFAQSERYKRLARLDIHSFFTAHALYELDKVITAADLPDEGWSDGDLLACLKGFKKRYPANRQTNKIMVHGGNYLMGPYEAQENLLVDHGVVVPVAQIKRLFGIYFELFPEIPRWHHQVTAEAQRGWLRTPFGNIHRFYDVTKWEKGPKGWEQKLSGDAKRAVAFLPQSSARFILTRAAQRLPKDIQQYLRLFVHDELLGLCPQSELARCLQGAKAEMERPIPQLNNLVVRTEAKVGARWGSMEEVSDVGE